MITYIRTLGLIVRSQHLAINFLDLVTHSFPLVPYGCHFSLNSSQEVNMLVLHRLYNRGGNRGNGQIQSYNLACNWLACKHGKYTGCRIESSIEWKSILILHGDILLLMNQVGLCYICKYIQYPCHHDYISKVWLGNKS